MPLPWPPSRGAGKRKARKTSTMATPAAWQNPKAAPNEQPISACRATNDMADELESLLAEACQGWARSARRLAYRMWQWGKQATPIEHDELLVLMGMRWKDVFACLSGMLAPASTGGSTFQHSKDAEEEWLAACNLLQFLPPALIRACFNTPDHANAASQLLRSVLALVQLADIQAATRQAGMLALLRMVEDKQGAACAVQAFAHKVLLRSLDRPGQDQRSILACLYYLAADETKVQNLLLKYGLLPRVLKICKNLKSEALYEAVQVIKMMCNSPLCCAALEAADGRQVLASICSKSLNPDAVNAAQVALKRLVSASQKMMEDLNTNAAHSKRPAQAPASSQRPKPGSRSVRVTAISQAADPAAPRTPVRSSPHKGPVDPQPATSATSTSSAASSLSDSSLRRTVNISDAADVALAGCVADRHQTRSLSDAWPAGHQDDILDPLANPGVKCLKACLSMTHASGQSAGSDNKDTAHLLTSLLQRGNSLSSSHSSSETLPVASTGSPKEQKFRFFKLVTTQDASMMSVIKDGLVEQSDDELMDVYLPLPPSLYTFGPACA